MRDYRDKYTPRREAQDLIDLAELDFNSTLLEPSAGNGNIIKQVHVRKPHLPVTAIEVDTAGLAYLHGMSNVKVINQDFLEYPIENKFDRIIANPPFDRDIWLLHFFKMYEHLNENGIMVCIVPKAPIHEYNGAWIRGALKKLEYFLQSQKMTIHDMKNWVTNKNGSVTEIEVIKWRK
jgi:trans-aconitate methyltransferase